MPAHPENKSEPETKKRKRMESFPSTPKDKSREVRNKTFKRQGPMPADLDRALSEKSRSLEKNSKGKKLSRKEVNKALDAATKNLLKKRRIERHLEERAREGKDRSVKVDPVVRKFKAVT